MPELGSHGSHAGSHAGRRSGPRRSDAHHAEMAGCPAERRHLDAQVLAARSSQHGSAVQHGCLHALRRAKTAAGCGKTRMRCSHVLAACGILRRSCMHTADNVSGRACPASNLAKVSKSSGSQTSIVARLTQSFCKSWSEGARSVAPAVRQAQATPKPPTLPAFRLQSTRVVPSTCSRHDAAACCSTASDAGSARSPSPQRADMFDMCPSGNKWRELMKPGKMLVSSKAMQATCAEARCFSIFDWREGELTSTQMTSSHNISRIPHPECKQQPP